MEDSPPSYEEVLNQIFDESTIVNSSADDFDDDRTIEHDEQRNYWFFLRVNFTIFDIAITILALFGYIFMATTSVFDVTIINISELCGESIYCYNRPNETVGLFFIYIGLGTIFVCICMTSLLSFFWDGTEAWITLLIIILRKIWIIMMGFLFLCIEVHILQLTFGVPRPFYFSNSTLYNYYCGKGRMTLSKELNELDKEMRMSFPSFVLAVDSFATAFLVFYFDHFDVGLGPHTAQCVIILLFGGKCTADGVRQYVNHEHHLSDILVGAGLGIVMAAFTVRNLKGTVLRDIRAMPNYVANCMMFDRFQRITKNFFASVLGDNSSGN